MCEKQRDSKGKGGGTERVYAVQQHTASASIWQPCSACRQDSVMRERERKRKERERSQKKERGEHNCKNGIRMKAPPQQGIIYCSRRRTELPVGFGRRSVSSGCFAL